MKRVLSIIAVLALAASVPTAYGADFDGDGTNDIGIFRPSAGLWAVRGVTRVYFGSSGDEPVPGDYNGDGVVDICLFRPSSGLWAVRGVTRAYFGGSGDDPLAGISAGGGGGLWNQNGDNIYFNTGNVGIGSTTPSEDLDIWDVGGSGFATLGLHGPGTNGSSIINIYEGAVLAMALFYAGSSNKLYIYDEVQDEYRVTFERAGNVGIGTTTPSAKLHVYGDNSQPGLIVRGGHSGSPPYNDLAQFWNGSGSQQFWFSANGDAGAKGSWGAFSPYISMHFIPDDREKDDYEIGDLVSAIDRLAVKTSGAFDQAVVGVICPPEGFISIPTELKQAITEEGKTVDDFMLVPVAYLGNVRVKVNNQGGPIRSGDLIVPSSVPGVAMKGEPESFKQYASVLGKAREDFEVDQGLIWVSVGVK